MVVYNQSFVSVWFASWWCFSSWLVQERVCPHAQREERQPTRPHCLAVGDCLRGNVV